MLYETDKNFSTHSNVLVKSSFMLREGKTGSKSFQFSKDSFHNNITQTTSDKVNDPSMHIITNISAGE